MPDIYSRVDDLLVRTKSDGSQQLLVGLNDTGRTAEFGLVNSSSGSRPISTDPRSAASLGAYVDYREFGDWLTPGQDTGSNWQKVIDQMPAGGTLCFGTDRSGTNFQFSQGCTIRKRLGIIGGTFKARLDFIPTTTNDTFLTYDGINAAASEATDELQLDGLVLRDLKILSDRSVQANGIRARRTDNGRISNVFVIGFDGTGLELENSREFSLSAYRSRFNGHLETSGGYANVHLSKPDMLWHGPSNFFAATTTSVASTGSQTVAVTNTIYTDRDGVILGLSVGASFTIDDGSANNRETVVVTAISGLNVTATFSKTHVIGADVLILSDNTNYCICNDVKLIFPFWNALETDNTSSQTIAGIMIHMLPDGSTDNGKNLEGNIVRWFGGSKGFTGGIANNIYAGLHKSVTGNESSIANLKFHPEGHMWASAVVAKDSKKLRLSDGVILGGATNYVVRVEGNGVAANATFETLIPTEVSLSNIDVSAAASDITNLTPFSQIGATITADTTTDIITLGGTLIAPPTGFPVLLKHATNDSNLPAGLTGFGQCMYAIRLTSNTLKVARTRKQALKGVAVDITTAGIGTSYMQLQSGAPISAWNSAKVFLDPTVRIDDGAQAISRDTGLPAPLNTTIVGIPTLTQNFTVQTVLPFIVSTLNATSSFAGTQLGLGGEKFAFGGALPVVLPVASASQAAATDAATTQILANSMRSALVSAGIIKGSA